jgi:hypothetical protein
MSAQRAGYDPFRALDLDRRADLADDDVRSAWRRVAAATHPDRADGGDPAAFAAAAAAYTMLRTAAGRGEALADLRSAPAPLGSRARTRRPAGPPAAILVALSRVSRGRPIALALRSLAATAVSAVTVAVVGWQPASAAVITGALTWLVLTGRGDLAEPLAWRRTSAARRR